MINETFLSLFGARLRAGRKELGLTQEQAADAVGVTREHWGRCERGLVMPGGEVLAAWAAAGADVQYLLTGTRDYEPPAALKADEIVLLDYFRAASPEVRKAALGALIGARPGRSGAVQQVFHAEVGATVTGDIKNLTVHSPVRPKR